MTSGGRLVAQLIADRRWHGVQHSDASHGRAADDQTGQVVIKETLRTDAAPSSALYAQGVKVGPTIYVSGMVGIDPTTGQLAGPTIQEQTRQALANCAAVLEAGGAALADVVEVGVLLADPDHFAGMNEAYAAAFLAEPPARYVAKLGVVLPGVLVSVRMTAIAPS